MKMTRRSFIKLSILALLIKIDSKPLKVNELQCGEIEATCSRQEGVRLTS